MVLAIWSGLYNISVEILRVLTITLTRASARTRARAMVSSRLGLVSVFMFKHPGQFL